MRTNVFHQKQVLFSHVGRVAASIIVTKVRALPASNSTLYYEQACKQMEFMREAGVLTVPTRLVGLGAEIGRPLGSGIFCICRTPIAHRSHTRECALPIKGRSAGGLAVPDYQSVTRTFCRAAPPRGAAASRPGARTCSSPSQSPPPAGRPVRASRSASSSGTRARPARGPVRPGELDAGRPEGPLRADGREARWADPVRRAVSEQEEVRRRAGRVRSPAGAGPEACPGHGRRRA